MNKYTKLLTAIAAAILYGLVLRYAAPSREPYFLLGIGLIGYLTWLYGAPAGAATAFLMVPATMVIYNQFEISINYGAFASAPAFIGLEVLVIAALSYMRRYIRQLMEEKDELEQVRDQLQAALAEVKELGGIHSICSTCHKIQDDHGNWMLIDRFLGERTKMEFSHAICPNCISEYR